MDIENKHPFEIAKISPLKFVVGDLVFEDAKWPTAGPLPTLAALGHPLHRKR
jgi:hypothetical protein